MFNREILDKFTEFTFLKFLNLPSETREISKFQKIDEVNSWLITCDKLSKSTQG